MRFCMTSKFWRGRRMGLLVITLIMLCWAVGVSMWLFLSESDSAFVWVVAVAIFLFGIGQFLYFLTAYMRQGRKYCMDECGITVSYLPKQKRFYPWDAFRGAVVCDFGHASKNPENCFLIIRLTAVEETNGPYSKDPSRNFWGMEHWRSYEYTMREFDRVIFLGFSPTLLDEVRRLSKLPVKYSLTNYGKELMERNTADENWDR